MELYMTNEVDESVEKTIPILRETLNNHDIMLDGMSAEFTKRMFESNNTVDGLEQSINNVNDNAEKCYAQFIIDIEEQRKFAKNQLDVNANAETLYKKFIKDIEEQRKYSINQSLINKNVEQTLDKLKDGGDEFKEFKSRVNIIISALQVENEENEKYRISKESQMKRFSRIENKLNEMSNKIKKIEDTLTLNNTDTMTDTINEIVSKCLKVKDDENALILSNIIKTSNNRYDELNSKFRKLIDEIDLVRDNKYSSTAIEINEINKKINLLNTDISKITSFDITKIKMNKTDISNIDKKIKEKIDFLSINITEKIREQITKSQVQQVQPEFIPKHSKQTTVLPETDKMNSITERLSNIEQQMICQMSMFHSISTTAVSQYQYSAPKLYSD